METSAILGLLNFLPAALQAGLEVKDMINQVQETVPATTDAERFALNVLDKLPAAIAAGLDVAEVVTSTNRKVQEMLAAGRSPTEQEWTDQGQRLAVLEEQWKAASKA